MAPATTSRVDVSPIRHPACQSFESIASDVSCSSSSIGCQSRDSSISSRTSANSSKSSLTHIPPWETRKPILNLQLRASNYYDYDLPCEFEFLGCNLRFHPEYFEAWISHTASHFVRTSPPPCTVCTFCDDERFEDYEDPVSNWRRRMIHIGGHLAEGSCNGFQPDYWVIEHMLGKDLLSKDDYTWAMQHARKPKFEDLVHEKVERKRNSLQKEDRQRRREKHKGKGRSEKNHSIPVRERKQRHVVVVEQDGCVIPCPGSTSIKEPDYRSECKTLSQTKGREVSRIHDEDDLLTIGLERAISQDDSTMDSISFSEETDIEEVIDCFVPPSYAVVDTVQIDRRDLPSMTSVQIQKADQLMEEFLLKFRVDWQNTSPRKHAPSSSSGKTSKPGQGSHSVGSTERKGKKRSRGNDQDEGSDNESGEGLRGSQKASTTGDSAEASLLFACPYRKRNPKKYSVLNWGPCALTGHVSIARVKGHLYRHHLINQCQRCKELFKNEEELDIHIEGVPGVEGCVAKASFPVEGITRKMKEQLVSRKKAFPGQTQSQVWEQIYRLLFPGEEVPDPYFEAVRDSQEHDDLTRFEEYTFRELPRFFEEVVQNAVTSSQFALEEDTRTQMMSLLPEALNRFFAAFRATRDRIPSARLQNDNPPDLSTLQITQRVPQAAQSMLSFDSGYRSDRPVSPTLHRAPGSVGDQFIDLGDSTRPFGVGPAANTPERASSEFGNLPSSEQFQTTTGGIEAAGPYLLSSSDINLLSGDNAFLGDELSFPPGPWPINPDYMSLDSERDWNGNFD